MIHRWYWCPAGILVVCGWGDTQQVPNSQGRMRSCKRLAGEVCASIHRNDLQRNTTRLAMTVMRSLMCNRWKPGYPVTRTCQYHWSPGIEQESGPIISYSCALWTSGVMLSTLCLAVCGDDAAGNTQLFYGQAMTSALFVS